VVTRSTASCLVKGRVEFLANRGLHSTHGHHKEVRRDEPSSVLLVNLGCARKTFSNCTRVGVAEPRTGERQPVSGEALLAVQQVLASGREVDTESMQADADAPLEPPIVPPAKEPEPPEVNWAGVPKTSIPRCTDAWISLLGSLWGG